MSSEESSEQRDSSGTDDDSDTDLATVLTQLIRRLLATSFTLYGFVDSCFHRLMTACYLFAFGINSGRAHILSERNLGLEERSESFTDFVTGIRPPPPDPKPDISALEVLH